MSYPTLTMKAMTMILVMGTSCAVRGDVPDYDFDWITIGDLANPGYHGGPYDFWTGRGSVDYEYRISRTQISSAQWLEFINTFAPQSDSPLSFLKPIHSGLIHLIGSPGTYQLSPWIDDPGSVPVQGISWRDAAMYCNWLHNDKSSEWQAIMDGAYDASTFQNIGPGSAFSDQATHFPEAKFWIPTLDEWLKAVHYDPNHGGPGEGGWWLYPHGSDEPPVPGVPGIGTTSAGEFENTILPWHIPLDSYPDAQTPWGLLDVSGAASEWTEEVNYSHEDAVARVLKSSWAGSENFILEMDMVFMANLSHPQSGAYYAGFRVASVAPDPCAADFTGDGMVSVADLLVLLQSWGPCPDDRGFPADLDNSGTVDVADLLYLLSQWGQCS